MKKYDVAAYIWPSYTGDELRTRMFWPEGMGEWETVRDAKPKFEGHQWPRLPLLGFQNEADAEVMEQQIKLATDHGVNVFIYDWYWYDRRPFLENCLNDGFLKARNNKDMKFYLMWANHNATHLWNRWLSSSDCGLTTIWEGGIDRQGFEYMANRLVDKYFHYDNYYKIDGKPVFMIYEVPTFIKGMGGIEEAAKAIAWFKELVISKGYPGVHMQYCVRGDKTVDLMGLGGETIASYDDTVQQLHADSCSHYQFCQITNVQDDYENVLLRIKAEYDKIDATYKTTYFPHVSAGWDNNARYTEFRPKIMRNSTPENFEKGLRLAKEYVDSHDLPVPLITINAWNEWTENSVLLPDNLYGYGFLEAVKHVFIDEE